MDTIITSKSRIFLETWGNLILFSVIFPLAFYVVFNKIPWGFPLGYAMGFFFRGTIQYLCFLHSIIITNEGIKIISYTRFHRKVIKYIPFNEQLKFTILHFGWTWQSKGEFKIHSIHDAYVYKIIPRKDVKKLMELLKSTSLPSSIELDLGTI